MVRKGGFEPPRLSAPPPQDGVSASSTTSARMWTAPAGQQSIIAKGLLALLFFARFAGPSGKPEQIIQSFDLA